MSADQTPSGSPGGRLDEDAKNLALDEYFASCKSGSEVFSERKMARIIGENRTTLKRDALVLELPESLGQFLMD